MHSLVGLVVFFNYFKLIRTKEICKRCFPENKCFQGENFQSCIELICPTKCLNLANYFGCEEVKESIIFKLINKLISKDILIPILVMILLILFICLIIVKITRKKVIEYQISWKAENLDDEQEMDQLDQPTRPIKIRRSFDSVIDEFESKKNFTTNSSLVTWKADDPQRIEPIEIDENEFYDEIDNNQGDKCCSVKNDDKNWKLKAQNEYTNF